MTHDELLDAINKQIITAPPFALGGYTKFLQGLSAVVELHKPHVDTVTGKYYCEYCDWIIDCQDCHTYTSQECEYPCPTIQAIEEELK